MTDEIDRTEEEWRKILTPEQYRILREKGTERAFTGKLYHHEGKGTYKCAGCGNELFRSEHKYESGSGWPSFFQAIDPSRVKLVEDHSHGMHRIEVMCRRCGGHLGHVFDDGPQPTGVRFCINSASLDFEQE